MASRFGDFVHSRWFYSYIASGGYNYEVAANGSIHQFRSDGAVTAAQHQQSMNDGRAISICIDGNFDIEEPTAEQKKSVADLLKIKMKLYGILPENVFCHRKVAQYKSCPGNKLPNNIYSYFIPMPSLLNAPSDWAKKDYQFLIDNNVISKDTNPQSTVSVEQLAVILGRLIEKKLI